MGVIYTMERHHELLHLWRERTASSLRVAHLDFHCDMRGMLIDRRVGRAYRIRDRFPELDQGNFLTHAIFEGRIDGIRWVHDEPGGRADDVGTVKYESDFSAFPHRLALRKRSDQGIPLDYEVVRTSDWDGLREGELLDIDWDYFASLEYSETSMASRIEAFWARMSGSSPGEVYICYSPEYSHPSRDLFARFVSDMAERFESTIVERVPPHDESSRAGRPIRRYVPDRLYVGARATYRRLVRAFKKRGVF